MAAACAPISISVPRAMLRHEGAGGLATEGLGLASNPLCCAALCKYAALLAMSMIETSLPPITLVQEIRLTKESLWVGEVHYSASLGAWAIWIPAFRSKILHAVDGLAHCTAGSTPPRDKLLDETHRMREGGLYSLDDWRAALSKDVLQRTAENYVSAQRLQQAGLGPAVLGICLVLRFSAWYAPGMGYTAGIVVEDLNYLPRKWRKATMQQMLDAGVQPDRIQSSIRQQIRGYVSDLNSVVGVMPINAEQEVLQLTDALRDLLRVAGNCAGGVVSQPLKEKGTNVAA